MSENKLIEIGQKIRDILKRDLTTIEISGMLYYLKFHEYEPKAAAERISEEVFDKEITYEQIFKLL